MKKFSIVVFLLIFVWSASGQSGNYVTLQFDITCRSTNQKLQGYKVFLTDKENLVKRYVSKGMKVKKGKYSLEIEKSGYTFPGKDIVIDVDGIYLIKEKLSLKGRAIAIEATDKDGNVVVFKSLKINDKVPSAQDVYIPGTVVRVIGELNNGKKCGREMVVPHGEGVFIVNFHLTPKTSHFSFLSRKQEIKMDGILYQYKFYLDGKEIEKRSVSIKKGDGNFLFTLQLNKEGKKLDIYKGYYWRQVKLPYLSTQKILFHYIDFSRLIKHLDKLENDMQWQALDRMFKKYSFRRCLKNTNLKNEKQISTFIEKIKKVHFPDSDTKKDILKIVKAVDSNYATIYYINALKRFKDDHDAMAYMEYIFKRYKSRRHIKNASKRLKRILINAVKEIKASSQREKINKAIMIDMISKMLK